MKNWCIYFAVTVSGACVLAIEMLGTRILGPFYGVSLYLWSALISVTLAALSLGYAIGGRLADRGPTLRRFAMILALAGLWIVLIPWLRTPILSATQPLGLRAAVLLAATLLFFPPLVLMGMVSPYAIRLKATSLDVVGTTAGNLFAVSTVASVISAVATGFILIPVMGVYSLVTIIGALMLVTAAIVNFGAGSKRVISAALIILAAAGVILLAKNSDTSAHPETGLIDIQQSLYGEIRVVDVGETRHMVIDGGTHTIIDKVTGESFFGYVDVVDLVRGYFDHAGDLLLVGLGGGSVAKNFAREGWHVDAVEIDPVVTSMAIKHFGLKPHDAMIWEMDGRQFFLTRDTTYDVIILDAFGSSSIPFHLVTAEAFALAHSRLRAGGVLAMNIEAVGWDDPLVGALYATLKTQFQYAVVLPIAEPPNHIGNLIIFAADRPLETLPEPPNPYSRFSAEYNRAHAWDNRFEPKGEARVLTDAHNPVDVWAERINLEARKQLQAYFGDTVRVW